MAKQQPAEPEHGPHQFNAVGVATRSEHGHVLIAFAREHEPFKLLLRDRELVLARSLLSHPSEIEIEGHFHSEKISKRDGVVRGHLHLCSCRYPDGSGGGGGGGGPAPPTQRHRAEPEPEPERMVLPNKHQRDQLFDQMDTSGDGSLTEREVQDAISKQWPEFSNPQALKRAMAAADAGGAREDGRIERNEFKSMLHHLVFFTNVGHKFDSLDTSHDGRLSLDEFKRGAAAVGISASPAELEKEFGAMDLDDSHTAMFDEFCSWASHWTHRVARTAAEADADTPEEAAAPAPVPPSTPAPPSRKPLLARTHAATKGHGLVKRVEEKKRRVVKHPTYFTVWILTKSAATRPHYAHLRNLAHAFMKDSSDLVPLLRVHRKWVLGEFDKKDRIAAADHAPPPGVAPLVLPEPTHVDGAHTHLLFAPTASAPPSAAKTMSHARSNVDKDKEGEKAEKARSPRRAPPKPSTPRTTTPVRPRYIPAEPSCLTRLLLAVCSLLGTLRPTLGLAARSVA